MRRILAVLALGAVVLVGCGDDADDTPEGAAGGDTTTTAADTTEVATDAPVEPAVLDVTSAEFGYELSSAEVPAGPVQVNQTNAGELEHQVTIIGLDGMTPDELVTTIAEEGDDALDPAVFAGGPNTVGEHGPRPTGGGGVRRLLLPARPRRAGDGGALHRHRRGPGRGRGP